MITWNGNIYQYCAELNWAAHAKWTKEEKEYYAGIWTNRCEANGKIKKADPKVYKAWFDRWHEGTGHAFSSPVDILKQIGGTSPNEAYLGIELLDKKPTFTCAQHVALAELCKSALDQYSLFDTGHTTKDYLPQAWLCTHSDVSPIRRWAIKKNGKGFAYDCRYDQLNWNVLVEIWQGT